MRLLAVRLLTSCVSKVLASKPQKSDTFTSCGRLHVLTAQEALAALLARALFLGCTVAGGKWTKMTNDQRKAALSRVHHVSLDESSPNSVATINTKLVQGESRVFQQVLSAGVDWVTLDILKFIAHKAEGLISEGKVT